MDHRTDRRTERVAISLSRVSCALRDKINSFLSLYTLMHPNTGTYLSARLVVTSTQRLMTSRVCRAVVVTSRFAMTTSGSRRRGRRRGRV